MWRDIVGFSIGFRRRPYNTLALPVFNLGISGGNFPQKVPNLPKNHRTLVKSSGIN